MQRDKAVDLQGVKKNSFTGDVSRRAFNALLFGTSLAFAMGASGNAVADETGEFQPSEGKEVPVAQVRFAMQPFGDTTVGFVALKAGFFKDAGIEVVPEEGQTQLADQTPGMLLSGQLDITIGYVPAMVQNYANQSTIKMVQLHNTYVGNYILCRTASGAKTFDAIKTESMSFEEAAKQTIAQMTGKSVAIADQSSPRNLLNLALNLAGTTPSDLGSLEVLDDTKIVQLGIAGNVDFVLVGGAAQNVQLLSAGFERMFGFDQLAQYLPSGDPAVSESFGHVGIVATSDYLDKNVETVLRFMSAYWRTIDYIKSNPTEALALSLPNLNAAAGVQLSVDDSVKLFSQFYSLISYEDTAQIVDDANYALGLEKIYGAQIAAAKKAGIIPSDMQVTPGDIVVGGRLFHIMDDLKKKYEQLLAGNPSIDEETKQKSADYYQKRNYLDAYRQLKASV